MSVRKPTPEQQAAIDAAGEVLASDPALAAPGHEGLRRLKERYSGREEIDFSRIS